MSLVGLDDLSFALQLESLDARQLKRFIESIEQVRFLALDEPSICAAMEADPRTLVGPSDLDDTPEWARWIGSFTVHYLLQCRLALTDRFALAYEHFGLESRGFAHAIQGSAVGDLIRIEHHLTKTPALRLDVGTAISCMLDRIVGDDSSQDVDICRMAHSLSSRRAPEIATLLGAY